MAIDRAIFAQECIRKCRGSDVDPHYMLGVAQLRSGISDGSDAGKVGPFRLTQEEWDANSNDDEQGIHFTPAQISNWQRQCTIFALMTHRAIDAFVSTNHRNPSPKELYLQQTPTAATATFPAEFQKALDDTADLLGPAAEAVDPTQTVAPITNVDEPRTPQAAVDGDGPEWYKLALGQIGIHEVGDNRGPDVARYCILAQCGQEGEPWCAIFANAMLASCHPPVPGTRDPAAQSFSKNKNFVKLDGPTLGAIAVFFRNGMSSGKGHVGFYSGENSGFVWVLGGNEDDRVEIEAMSKGHLLGYWWPASINKPTSGKITLAENTPMKQTKVT